MSVLVPDSVGPFTSLQAVFDRAWAWSLTHGKCGDDEGCLFRLPDFSNACLIGCCIPDSRYSKLLEGDVETLARGFPKLFSDIFAFGDDDLDEVINQLQGLQECHDNADTTYGDYHARVRQNLRSYAENHKLVVPS